MLFPLWSGSPHRATKDMDLLGDGPPQVDRLVDIFRETAAIPATDGVVFERNVSSFRSFVAGTTRMTRRPRPPPQARRPERRLASIILVAIVPTVASIVAVDLTENRSD